MVTAIVPGDHRRNGDSIPADEDAGFAHARDANGRDTGRARGGVQRQAERVNRSIEQLLGGELDTVRRGDPWGAGTALADDLTLMGEDDRLCRAGPHVQTHKKCHILNLRGCRVDFRSPYPGAVPRLLTLYLACTPRTASTSHAAWDVWWADGVGVTTMTSRSSASADASE